MIAPLAGNWCITTQRWLLSRGLPYLVCLLLWSVSAHARNYAGLNTVLTQQGEIRAGVRGSFAATGYALRLAPDGRPTFHRVQGTARMPTDGVSRYVYCLVSDGAGNLYVGGIFDHAEGIIANAIAKWNGKTWSALGMGLTVDGKISGQVYALALDKKGNLYAGGRFSQAGEVKATNVAKWDGTAWSALGSGRLGSVEALAVDKNGILYAGGLSAKAGSIVSGGAKWDGASWSPIGYLGFCHIRAMVFDKHNNLYVGFLNTPDMGGHYIEGGRFGHLGKWNGSVWEPVGRPGPVDGIRAVALDSSGNIYIGGSGKGSVKAAAEMQANIAKWDGGSWRPFDSDIGPGRVDAIAVSGTGEIYIGGQLHTALGATVEGLAKWNGKSWVALEPPMIGEVSSILFDKADAMYVGGTFYRKENGGGPGNYVAKWNGKNWLPLETGAARPSASPKPAGAKSKAK